MPEQVRVLPISDRLIDGLCEKSEEQLSRAGIRVSCDTRSEKVGYKIREAQFRKNSIYACDWQQRGRRRYCFCTQPQRGDSGSMPVESFLSKILQEIATKAK